MMITVCFLYMFLIENVWLNDKNLLDLKGKKKVLNVLEI